MDGAALVALLKACAKNKDLRTGTSVHADIIKQHLLEKNPFVVSALITMYSRCGAVMKAKEVLDGLLVKDVVTWSALIGGYAQGEHAVQALNCFEQMQCEGVSPNVVTFICILKACGALGALERGRQVHSKIVTLGLLHAHVLGSTLVDMYVKCGSLAKAHEVLDGLPVRNVITWNVLIAGYAHGAHGKEALNCFEWMQYEGLLPDSITFACILKTCGSLGALDKGRHVHFEIVRQGFLDGHVLLGNAVVDMYAKCGALEKAKDVFEELFVRDVISWNALITGYAQQEYGIKALDYFEAMFQEGLFPDAVTLICILKVCGSIQALKAGKSVHSEIVQQGILDGNPALGNAIVDMYAKCGAVARAKKVLDGLPRHDVVSWNSLIAGYVQQDHGKEALKCFEQMQQQGVLPDVITFACSLRACGGLRALEEGRNIHLEIVRQGWLQKPVVLYNALVDMYARCGAFARAKAILESLPIRDEFSWNALIAGYMEADLDKEALQCFECMQNEGIIPNANTFVWIMKACANIGDCNKGKDISIEIARLQLLGGNIALAGALLDMHVKCGQLMKAKEMFEGLPVRNVVMWNVLIAGYVEQGYGKEALNFFEQMKCEGLCADTVTLSCILKACGSISSLDKGRHVHFEIAKQGLLCRNIILGNAVVNMYARCGSLVKAREILEGFSIRDVVSWSIIITGYIQRGHDKEAVRCFEIMQNEGLFPNIVTFTCIVKACGNIGALCKGENIHSEIIRQGLLDEDIVPGNALVDMYVKCGALERAREVLEGLFLRNVVTWSTLIAGYARKEDGKEALACFEQMQHEGFFPNTITFLCGLKACSSIGALDKGERMHSQIVGQGLLGTNTVLGSALVDMYAKCGAFLKAKEVLEWLPIRDVVAWNALIAGYARGERGKEAVVCFEQMQGEGLAPDEITFLGVLTACSHSDLLYEGQECLTKMSIYYDSGSYVRHYTCIVNLLCRLGLLDQAVAFIGSVPSFDETPVWRALLSDCIRWGNTKLGSWAFKQVMLSHAKAASCLCKEYVSSDSPSKPCLRI